VSGTQSSGAPPRKRDELYETAIREFGRALDRLAAGYEADPERSVNIDTLTDWARAETLLSAERIQKIANQHY